MTNNEVNLDELLQVDSTVKETFFDKKHTKTSLFLLPMLKLDVRMKGLMEYMAGSFIDDHAFEHVYTHPIFILLRVADYDEVHFHAIDNFLKSSANFCYEYYAGFDNGKNLLMYVFETPVTFRKDYELFKQGKYSQFSSEYKIRFPEKLRYSDGKVAEYEIWGTLYKSDNRRAQIQKELELSDVEMNGVEEYYSAPTMERECFRFNPNKNETD